MKRIQVKPVVCWKNAALGTTTHQWVVVVRGRRLAKIFDTRFEAWEQGRRIQRYLWALEKRPTSLRARKLTGEWGKEVTFPRSADPRRSKG